uniref:C2H2-type domain-containing protein n=1 Tax=Bubo bubo TaxID=30461 RepID=A0A8C0EFT5_BUBBB
IPWSLLLSQHSSRRSWRTVSRGREPTPEQGRSVRSPPPEEEGAREGLGGAQVPSGLEAEHSATGGEKEEKGREGAEQAETWSRWLLFMCLKSPQLSPFGLPTGAGTDKQKEEQCQPREEQRGMLQGPKEEPQRTYSSSRRKEEFKCEHCGKVFTCRSSLTFHQGIHRGDCGKSFTQRVSVLYQQKTHTNEKFFICTLCGKRFSSHTDLLKHKGTHRGEGPHACSHCGKCFQRRDHLKRHQRNLHNGECSVEVYSHIILFSAIKCREGATPCCVGL